MAIVKEAENGVKVRELCRKHGMSDATFYTWRAKIARTMESAPSAVR